MTRIESAVCEKIEARSNVGLKKYGVGMDRKDFTTLKKSEEETQRLLH